MLLHRKKSTIMALIQILITILYFLTTVNAAMELNLLKDINSGTGSSFPRCMASINSKVYFQADDGTRGSELWKTDGTTSGTEFVKAFKTGSDSGYPCYFTELGNKMIFQADTVAFGSEIHVMQSNEQVWLGTIKDINPGTANSNPGPFFEVGGNLLFSAVSADEGSELWKTDGTNSSTEIVKDIDAGTDGSSPQNMILF